MCLYQYKLYPSNTKVYSRTHVGRMLQSYRCGHCAECLEQTRKEWYFRSVYEFDSTVASNGYMLFDTLTYRPSVVPRVSRYYSVPKEMDWMCFDHADATNFLKDLRIRLERAGYDVKENLRYFYATEYGTDPNATHRPHIHILFFVRNSFIDPLVLSKYVSDTWKYGRTDGVAFNGKRYVLEKRVVRSDKGSSARVCAYVSKYVVKSLSYDNALEKRVNRLMWYFFGEQVLRQRVTLYEFGTSRALAAVAEPSNDEFYEFCASPRGKRIKASIHRVLDMFHRQSVGFGLSAIDNIDIDRLVETNSLCVRDCEQVVMRISLPTYYKRKLFQEKTEFKGMQCWQLNALGVEFQSRRHDVIKKRIKERLDVDCLNYDLQNVDTQRLTDYMLDERGCTSAPFSEPLTVDEKKQYEPYLFYSYSTPSDVQRFKQRMVTESWHGSVQTGYDDHLVGVPFNDFVALHVMFDSDCENWIRQLELSSFACNLGRDNAYSKRQHLTELYKSLF